MVFSLVADYKCSDHKIKKFKLETHRDSGVGTTDPFIEEDREQVGWLS